MKKILILLLFMGLGQQLKAQEEFLKLDSVVVLQGDFLETKNGNTEYGYHIDSIPCPQGSLVKVRSVTLYSKDANNSGAQVSSSIRIYGMRCEIDGVPIMTIDDHQDFSQGYKYERDVLYLFKEVDFIQTKDFVIECFSEFYYSNVYSYNCDNSYRIELVYYSYEN